MAGVVPSTVATTTTVAPTTTTLSRRVEAPDPADSFHYLIEFDALIKEPGTTDVQVEVSVEGDIIGDAERYSTLTLYGTTLVREEYLLIGDQAWVKEGRKPWQAYDAATRGELDQQNAAAVLGDYDDLYEGLSDLDWTIERSGGVEARRYELPTDRRLRLIDWFPNDLFQVLTAADDIAITVWIDKETNELLRILLDLAGGPDLLAEEGFDASEFAAGTAVTMMVSVEFSQHGVSNAVIEAPSTGSQEGVPDGYFLYEEPEYGFRLLLPLTWELLPGESYTGFAIPVFAVPSFDVLDDVLLSVSIEDLRAEPGLGVEVYAVDHVDLYAAGAPYTVLVSEPYEVSGVPGWRVVADIQDQAAPYVLETIAVLVGTDGYAVDYAGYFGWYDGTEDVRAILLESFELWEPGDPAST